jgi:hypothetical protein
VRLQNYKTTQTGWRRFSGPRQLVTTLGKDDSSSPHDRCVQAGLEVLHPVFVETYEVITRMRKGLCAMIRCHSRDGSRVDQQDAQLPVEFFSRLLQSHKWLQRD